MAISSGTRLGPYEVIASVGAGGMGEVYRARDTRLDRSVAIKVLPRHMASSPELRQRFEREARAISALNHPHICALYDIGQQDDVRYLVMELLDGETLSDRLARGPLPAEQALRVAIEIASALDRAHRDGVIHRDLKPGNVMLTRSGAKLLDFGLASIDAQAITHDGQTAALGTEQKPLTAEGTILGTYQYMSPEQVEGLEADRRSDIFAFGALLYEMMTGRRAFEGRSRASVIAAILERQPVSVSSIQPTTPAALDSVIRRCLAKNPDDRFQSARDLQIALEEIRDQLRSPVSRPVASSRVVRALIISAAIVAVIATAVGVWLSTRRSNAPAPAAAPKIIAVLPFANLGVEKSRDYLRLAIPDEITTILSYNSELAVRPFAQSRRLTGDVDPQEAAQKLNATQVVSGHMMDESGRLSVTIEAIDIAANRLLWHDVFDVASADLITMREELSKRIQNGLIPRLSNHAAPSHQQSAPENAEAYALFLHAAAASSDRLPNKEALNDLEKAVHLDPTYAPAWAALSKRAYYDYSYGDGGASAMQRTVEAAQRALALDPDLIDAAIQLIVVRTENGEAARVWRDTRQLVSRRPDSSYAHFLLSYVLRYGGELQTSVEECNAAFALDPGNRYIRSCALTLALTGDYPRAMEFANIDRGSEWSRNTIATILLRQGKYEEAARILPESDPGRRVLKAWLRHEPQVPLDATPGAITPGRDGEPLYFAAENFSLTGRPDDAVNLLRESIRRNYCGSIAMDTDPLLANIRSMPEYKALHDGAVACHEKFLRER